MSAVAYQMLQLGASYLLKTIKICGNNGFGPSSLVQLGALYDQIQLTYLEITAMMKPATFALDLFKDELPVQVELSTISKSELMVSGRL